MKKRLLWSALAVVTLAGCATSERQHYYSSDYYRAHPDVVVEGDGTRTYVREYDYDARASDRDRLQPRYRGKHADALGWNDPYWYHQP